MTKSENSYRYYALILLLISTFAFTEIYAQDVETIKNRSLKDRKFNIEAVPDSLVYALPHRNIIKDSETLISGTDTLIRSIDYTIDYSSGVLELTDASRVIGSIDLFYRVNQPFDQIIERYWTGLTALEDDSIPRTKFTALNFNARQTIIPFREERLKSRGSLVRGVKVGTNEGLSLNSGLRLQLEGEISDGINLVASMTDRNSPIQPEGNTQTLKEIDKVYVGLRGRDFDLTLGDISADYRGTTFSNYRRKLQGGSGNAKAGSTNINLTGAVSRGKFKTLSFGGIEGNQGPYRLTGGEGNLEVFIIAGSENVYIDGEKMSRGETNDYVIDYSNSELTFTPYRIITSDSRIIVDYEFSDRSYNRSVLASSLSTELNEGTIKIGSRYIRESDDQNNPIGTTFNEADLFALASSDEENLFVEGGSKVGIGKGAYIKIFNSQKRDSVFKYVGLNPDGTSFLGSWTVFFTQVGEGIGDYDNRLGDSLLVSTEGNFYFEYVGNKRGSYLASKRLRAPSTQAIASFDLSLTPTKNITFKSEIGLSNNDRNTLSSLNDGDNDGNALLIKGVYNTSSANQGGVIFDSYLRRISKDFNSVDRVDEIEFDRKWNKPPGLTGTETILEGGAKIIGKSSDELYGRYGRLEVQDSWESDKLVLGGERNIPFFGKLLLKQELLSSRTNDNSFKSDWNRRQGRLIKSWGRLAPTVGFEFEDKEDSDSLKTGFRYLEYFTGLKIKKIGPMNLLTEYRVRDDEENVNEILEPRSRAVSKTLGIEVPSTRIYSANLRLSRRTRDFRGIFKEKSADSQSNLIDMRSDLHPLKGAVRFMVDYRAASELLAGIERVYLKVEDGRGNFRFDKALNEYVPDDAGDFILRTRPTNRYEPVTDLRFSMRLLIEPRRLNRNKRKKRVKSNFPGNVSSRTFIRIDEKSKDSDSGAILRLEPSKFRNPNTTLSGNLTFEEDLTMLEKKNGSSLRLRYRYFENFNNQLISGGEESLIRGASFRWRQVQSTRTRYDIEGSRSSTLKTFSSSLRRNRDVISNELSFDLSHLSTSKVEIGAKLSIGRDEDRKSSVDLKANLTEITLRNNYFLKGKGMVRLLTSWAKVSVSPNDIPITFEMANGFQEGNNYKWSVGFDYKIGTNLNAMLTYEGKNESFRKTRHIGKAEVRAWF